jgi:hypothetical protein
MRRIAAVLAVASLTGLATISSAASVPAAGGQPRVTVIGDSVVTAVMYTPDARTLLGQNVDLRFLAAVCRRLVQPSCWYKGTRPQTALDLIQSAGASLGGTVIVESGYNEYVDQYPSDLDTIMRALVAAGVKTVLWVTLKEERQSYGTMNDQIRAATGRWPQLVVVDWNAVSRNRSWFVGDGLHLDSDGAVGMARMLRRYIVQYACGGVCRRNGPPD